MKRKGYQAGFGILGIVMVVATISLVGLVAFRFLDAQDNSQQATKNDPGFGKTHEAVAINSSSDVDKATTALENIDIGDSTDAELDTQLDF